MAFRSIRISQPANLSIKQEQLLIQQSEQVITIPLEDIATITLEDTSIRLSVHVLKQAASYGIVIIVCDDKHLPSGVFNSLYTHSKQLGVLKMQLELPKPFRKRCWQRIVLQKIKNQAMCCELVGMLAVAKELRALLLTVGSGDPTNREAYAARIYFLSLFSQMFRRKNQYDWRNAALNYGYAIIRAGVARSVAEYGFIPALGIHHRSELNTFNLVDDFLEPLRPLVDLFVYNWQQDNEEDISSLPGPLKLELTKLLHCEIRINKEDCSVLHAIDIMIKSFVSASRAVNSELLILPELLPIKPHSYE